MGNSHQALRALECGQAFFRFRCYSCGRLTDIKVNCNLRLCPRCLIRRADSFVKRHEEPLASMKDPKHLTLTFKTPNSLTPELISTYNQNFADLRRQPWWKEAVAGGVYSFELTYNDPGWHPHFHALIDSAYIPQPFIKRAWRDITKGSHIVFIQKCDAQSGIYEVAKYMTKGSQFYQNHQAVREYINSTKGRRLFATFGYFYAWDRAHPKEKPNHAREPPSRLLGTLPYGTPQIYECPKCHSDLITFEGKITPETLVAPPVQIPF